MGAPHFRALDGRVAWHDALFAGLALLAAARLGCGLLRLVPAMVPLVVRYGFRNRFGGKRALAAKMQNIVFDRSVGFGCFHGFLLFQGRALHLQGCRARSQTSPFRLGGKSPAAQGWRSEAGRAGPKYPPRPPWKEQPLTGAPNDRSSSLGWQRQFLLFRIVSFDTGEQYALFCSPATA